MTNWDDLKSGSDLANINKLRIKPFEEEKFKNSEVQNLLEEGWELVKAYKKESKLKMKKRIGDAFEDEVWALFYAMGFTKMNSTRHFVVAYSDSNPNLTKQIDVMAIDDEVCLFIECKAAEIPDTSKNWKTDLESIRGIKDYLFKEIQSKYPNRICKYIFATKNYLIGDQDSNRMNEFDIANFDYDTILYYKELAKHLGSASKYQLLGNLFAGKEIEGIQERVPALEGKMGNLTYYSFLIEPSRLLKMAYVLHRTNANMEYMPTYQRLIKKDRLQSVRSFIDKGGYFPNSLIVTIDREHLNFDSNGQIANKNVNAGILHLPKSYHSIYIIDGQHRLYGYTGSPKATSETVPVVAFVNLDKTKQVQMFMDINENQKVVSKTLRNTLNIDLLWNSESKKDSNLSLMLYVAHMLGEEKSSPLYGRVVTGENSTTQKRCITIECLKDAIEKTNFISKYKKNNDLISTGTLDLGNNDDTSKVIIAVLKRFFEHISRECSDEWDKGSMGFLAINNSSFALIKVFDDIINIVLKQEGLECASKFSRDPKTNANILFDKCRPYLDNLALVISDMSEDKASSIKKAKGGSANKHSWNTLQVELNALDPTFITDELRTYLDEKVEDYRDSVIVILEKINKMVLYPIRELLESKPNWVNTSLPDVLRKKIISMHAVEVNDREQRGDYRPVKMSEFIDYSNLKLFVSYQANWSNMVLSLFRNHHYQSMTRNEFLQMLPTLVDVSNHIKDESRHIQKVDFTSLERIVERFLPEQGD